LFRNSWKDSDMPAAPEPFDRAAAVKPTLQAAAKNLLFHLYGEAGPPWGTTFADFEELAVRLGQTLSTELLRQGLARQAATPPPQAHACPTCGGPVEAAEPEPRTLATRAGEVGWQEPKRYCGRCRKSFFPSVASSAD
jgi:hypothetical protein